MLNYTGHEAEIRLMPDQPVGPMNRVADNSLSRSLLGWEPKVTFKDGLRKTIDWYFRTKDPAKVRAEFERMLTER